MLIIRFMVNIGLLIAMISVVTTPVAAQEIPACEQSVVIVSGDSLSGLATRHLGSSAAYGEIVAATNARAAVDESYSLISNPALISVGWRICIPAAGATIPVVPTTRPQTGVTPTLTPTPAPTTVPLDPDAPNPLQIEVMRKETYPGSELVIQQTLDPGVNYSRFIVSYQSEGNKNFALLTVPQGETPSTGWPAIVFNHGYIRPEQYRTTERYVAYVDGFARNGYIVLRPDYRGHGFSEGEASGGYGSPAYTNDVLNAVASIKAYVATDPDRIGMWGHSMGGHITLRSMVVTDDIKAGVIWAGVVASYPDLLYNWHRSNRYRVPSSVPSRARRWRDDFLAAYGTPEENPEFWASISPITYVADLSGPIQLHHGTNDSSVPPEFSTSLYDEIEVAGGEVENYVYAGDDHNLAINFGTAMARSVAFFDSHLK